jgi:hypothetical protein
MVLKLLNGEEPTGINETDRFDPQGGSPGGNWTASTNKPM